MTELAANSPYKGPAYFTVQDRRFFFGRQSDTRRIADTVQTKTLSMVHARSGAGKTSLLRAGVIPALDGMGFEACYCRPGPYPARAVRCAAVLRGVSPPAREAAALDAAIAAFHLYQQDQAPNADPDVLLETIKDMHLHAFCAAYRDISVEHPAHRDMIVDAVDLVPESLEVPQTHSLAGLSMAGRLLVSLQGSEIYRHYLVRLCRLFDLPIFGLEDVQGLESMTIGQIKEFLQVLAQDHDYEAAIAPLLDDEDTLASFFLKLSDRVDRDGDVLPLRYVVIIDQFEEFFTRFGDGHNFGGADLVEHKSEYDYRVRDKFFEEIAELMGDEFRTGRDDVRFVISLRDDYVARLGRFELLCGEFASSQRNALPLLSPLDIEDVVRGPAQSFGVQFDDDVLVNLVDALTTEGREILPIKVQIVCSRLWSDHASDPDCHVIGMRAFDRYGGAETTRKDAVRLIIENYVAETLDALDLPEKMDAFRVLASMMTVDGTREVVPYDRLTENSFVNRDMRRRILKRLSDDSIITLESHRGGRSVEIKHEFLLGSIHRNLQESREWYPEWQLLQSALENLERGIDIGRDQLQAVVTHNAALEPALLRNGLAKTLFRLSALEPSHVAEETRKAWLACWAIHFNIPDDLDPEQVVAAVSVPQPGAPLMRRLRGLSDLSAVAHLSQDAFHIFLSNIIREVPAREAVPILTEVRRHVRRPD